MLLEIENIPGSGLRLIGEVDISNSLQVKGALAKEVARGGSVLLDLSGLTFADSTFFHLVIQCAQQLGDRSLVVASPTKNVEKVMDLLGLPRLPNVSVQHTDQTTGWGLLRVGVGSSGDWSIRLDRRGTPERLGAV